MRPAAPVIQHSGLVRGSVNQPFREAAVSIDSTIAQEWPMRPRCVHLAEINGHDEHFLLIDWRFGEDLAGSAGDETLAPELDAGTAHAFENLVSDTIGHRHEAAVGDRMAALDGFPCPMLSRAVFGFLGGMPSNGGRVE